MHAFCQPVAFSSDVGVLSLQLLSAGVPVYGIIYIDKTPSISAATTIVPNNTFLFCSFQERSGQQPEHVPRVNDLYVHFMALSDHTFSSFKHVDPWCFSSVGEEPRSYNCPGVTRKVHKGGSLGIMWCQASLVPRPLPGRQCACWYWKDSWSVTFMTQIAIS